MFVVTFQSAKILNFYQNFYWAIEKHIDNYTHYNNKLFSLFSVQTERERTRIKYKKTLQTLQTLQMEL